MSQYVFSPGVRSAPLRGRAENHYYVATTGNDTTGTGSSSNPWATIDKARSVIRSSGVGATSDVTVHVLPGRYFSTSVTFATADAPTGDHTIKYVCEGDAGTARLIGGTLATGWALHSGSIYKVALGAACSTLYENGVRAELARSPARNPGASFPCAFAPYYSAAGVDSSYTLLQYNPADFDPSTWTLADIRLFSWGALGGNQIDWFTDVGQATALDTGTKQFTIGNSGLKFPAFSSPSGGGRYVVQGPLQLLTGPGQFTYSGGFLYYWPRTAPIDQQEIIIPTVQTAVALTGDSTTSRIRNITFDGFQVEGTDFNTWYRYGTNGVAVEYDYFNTLSAFRQGGFRLENVDNITLRRNHIKNTGFAGVFMQGYCQYVTLVDNWIEHTGTDGVSVNGMPPGSGQLSRFNTFGNQRINNMGELDGSANGIRLSQSGYNTISYHHIYQGPRKAIWMHGDYLVAASNNYCQSNYVHHVKAQNLMQDSGDGGSLTMSFLSSPAGGGSTITQNRFSQCIVDTAQAHSSMLDVAPPTGVFGDNDSSGQLADNVQVSNTQGNFFRNNGSDGWVCTNCSFLTNGSVNGSFNANLMETATIGTVSGFPYT